jgi:hypothetical protein
MNRRAFLAGVAGAAAVGWLWLRDGGREVEPATDVATRTEAPPPSTTPQTTADPGTTAVPATTSTTTTTTTTVVPAVLIEALCRQSWGAAEPSGEFTTHTIERMTVHHTARLLSDNRNAPAAVRGHQRFHQGPERGWADIAYHFIIDLEGNVYECRPVDAVGDTGTNYDPTGHFLVCCEGDFNTQELPAAQQAALIDVLAWASEQFDVAGDTIRGHRDVASTSCPGDNLYTLIESGELAAAVDARVAAGGVQLEVVCGEIAAARVRAIEA